MKAFNLRGTNGSGKTHIARLLIGMSGAAPVDLIAKKPLVYRGRLFDKPFYILGSYVTQCGGCDTIPSVSIVAKLLTDLRNSGEDGIVFYEGLMISHMIGTVGNTVKDWGKDHIMGFLDTPVETCIARVKARRLEKGNFKPFDPNKTLVKDYSAVRAARKNAIRGGFVVEDIDHMNALQNVVKLLGEMYA